MVNVDINCMKSKIIKECQYPIWISDIVVEKKKNDNVRVCIRFTNLNKSCPRASFPFPDMDGVNPRV